MKQPCVQSGKTWKYAYATPTHVDAIWRWLHSYFSFPIEEINPPGINCLNGVVKIQWQEQKPTWRLVREHVKFARGKGRANTY